MKTLALFLFVLGIVVGCRGVRPLSLARENNTGNAFRLDGFYFGQFKKGTHDYTHVFVFYRNGVLLTLESDNRNSADNWKDYLTDSRYQNSHKTAPYWWGAYVMSDRSFRIEKWISTDYAYPVVQLEGKVLNDTTLLVKRGQLKEGKKNGFYPMEAREVIVRSDTLRFVELGVKPDSLNKWIR